MNTLLVFTLFIAACAADVSHVVGKDGHAAILEFQQDSSPEGAYKYGFKTENGIAAHAEGLPDGQVQGSYGYIDPTGQNIVVNWIAGPNGFQADGPTVPKTPEAIVRSLEYNAAHPYKEPTAL